MQNNEHVNDAAREAAAAAATEEFDTVNEAHMLTRRSSEALP